MLNDNTQNRKKEIYNKFYKENIRDSISLHTTHIFICEYIFICSKYIVLRSKKFILFTWKIIVIRTSHSVDYYNTFLSSGVLMHGCYVVIG